MQRKDKSRYFAVDRSSAGNPFQIFKNVVFDFVHKLIHMEDKQGNIDEIMICRKLLTVVLSLNITMVVHCLAGNTLR